MNDSNSSTGGFWDDAEVIHTYLVIDAINDGTMRLVEKGLATEAGFKIPVTITSGAWADLVAWERDDSTQDETGRLWDVLRMTHLAARRAGDHVSTVQVTVGRVPNRTRSGELSMAERPSRVTFHAVVQAYDRTGAPCLTIYLPEER